MRPRRKMNKEKERGRPKTERGRTRERNRMENLKSIIF
jgi:hypothetical protein